MHRSTTEYTRTRILILVKTYPQPSRRHGEVVCTAGITEKGEWVRLYPIDFRQLPADKQFGKYHWISVDLAPRGQANDNRKESRRPNTDSIQVDSQPIPTKDKWRLRREIVDRLPSKTLKQCIRDYEHDQTSLAVVKPSQILDVTIEPVDEEWTPSQQQSVDQLSLLSSPGAPLKKIPYRFRYRFLCEDDERPHNCLIEDWELGALYLNEERQLGDSTKAAESVRSKFRGLFAEDKDSRLYMGTTFPYNSWVVVGVFYPPREYQAELPL